MLLQLGGTFRDAYWAKQAETRARPDKEPTMAR